MEKLSMCRICLVENVRMCVVTDKSLQETYEKLTDVPFVTEDRKPMLACSFCCTRLKQCCQLQRKCVEAEELLAQMLSEDYEQKPLTIENLGFVSSFITSPVTHISIGADCQIGSDAIKQELPAVCEEQDDVELQLTHLSEGKALWQSSRDYFENLCNSHPDVEAHHSESEAGEDKFTVVIKMEEEHELSENRTDREIKKPELQNPDKSSPGIKDIPDHDSGSDSEDDVPLIVMKTEAEEGQEVSNKKRGACESQRADVAKSWFLSLKRKLEDIMPAKQTMDVISDSKIIRTTEISTSESVAKTKEPLTTTPQTRIHTNEKCFTCDICQRNFSRKCYIKTHLKVHTGEKPYQCDICKRSYLRKEHLKTHFRMHTGEKMYKCDECQYSTRLASSLKRHKMVHTGEKPYKCDVCQRSFRERTNLNNHFRTHTGEKPYTCTVCQRSFRERTTLNNHFRTHTGERPYTCTVCQRSFMSKGCLNVHFRKHLGK